MNITLICSEFAYRNLKIAHGYVLHFEAETIFAENLW